MLSTVKVRRGSVLSNFPASSVIRSMIRLREQFGPFDLEMLLLRGVDPVSHYFWKFREPDATAYRGRRPPPDELKRYGGTIENHYRYVDRLLAELGYKPAWGGKPARKAYAIACGAVITPTTKPAIRSWLKSARR